MATEDDEVAKDQAARDVGERAAQKVRGEDHPFLLAHHVDGLRETMRQVNWSTRVFERTMLRFLNEGVPAMNRLADELELARRGTLERETPAPKDSNDPYPHDPK